MVYISDFDFKKLWKSCFKKTEQKFFDQSKLIHYSTLQNETFLSNFQTL